MSRITRPIAMRFMLAAVAMLALGSAAGAQIIIDPFDPNKSTLQGSYIAVGGATNGIPDACGDARCNSFLVIIRDFSNTPVPGSTVIVDFSGCPDIQIACDQLTAATGQTYLGGKRVAGSTDALGRFTFRVIGSADATQTTTNTTSPGTNAGVPCAQVFADGVPLSPSLIVSAYDINGLGSPGSAVNGADASLVVAEVIKASLGAQPRARADYNGTNTVNGADAAIASGMVLQAALGTGSQSTGPFCP